MTLNLKGVFGSAPDDYVERFLPEVMARFARSNPRVELSVEPTVNLEEMIRRGTLDFSLVIDMIRSSAQKSPVLSHYCG